MIIMLKNTNMCLFKEKIMYLLKFDFKVIIHDNDEFLLRPKIENWTIFRLKENHFSITL